MAEYDNTNKGTLFQNERRDKATSPNYTGSININGEEFWLSAWVKESKAGKRFLSLSVSPKEPKKEIKDDFLDADPAKSDSDKPAAAHEDFGDAPFN